MDSHSITRRRESRPKTAATNILDRRLSAREGQLRDQQHAHNMARQQKHQATPKDEHLAQLPLLVEYRNRYGQSPSVARSAKARASRILRLEKMHGAYGPLVMVRISLPELDMLPLKSPDLVRAARAAMKLELRRIGVGARSFPYEVAIQRGIQGGTHAHIILPLACLTPVLRLMADRAAHGKGGGVEFGHRHLVVLGDEETDRQAVGSYLGRDPDARFDLPGDSLDYLLALEDMLMRRARGERSPRLSWAGTSAVRE